MASKKVWMVGGLLMSGITLVVGCGERSIPVSDASNAAEKRPVTNTVSGPSLSSSSPAPGSAGNEEHGHIPGAHGGIMVSLGRDSYHAEAVFEKGGVLRLYTLGKEESRVMDVEKQTLKGFVKAEGDSDARQFTLEAEPQDGDAKERTSQFIGTLPKDLWGKSLDVTIPNIVISGERFRLGFKSTPAQHEASMPSNLGDEEERKLYLTPGGKYTDADIKANGNVTASVKFKGLKASHDMSPKSGDKICPVTKTKANPQFTWIVDGKSYQFCCPPCVSEFVNMAKSTPSEILNPSEYVKAP